MKLNTVHPSILDEVTQICQSCYYWKTPHCEILLHTNILSLRTFCGQNRGSGVRSKCNDAVFYRQL
jgi:hypothetical protein